MRREVRARGPVDRRNASRPLHLMTAISLHQLQTMLPKACAWAEEQERLILANGVPLSPPQLADARAVGVHSPERIRLLRVDTMPLPTDPILHQAAQLTGLLTPNTIG